MLTSFRQVRVAALASLGTWLCFAGSVTAAQTFNEYQLKAVFLFRFTQFVEWPAATAGSAAPFAICVLGDDPFAAYLDETVRGETVQSRPIVVQRFDKADGGQNCSISFISASERDRIKPLAASLRDRGVLTVGDTSNFAEQGGMIELVTDDNRIRLKINVEAARTANLQISSKLLRPATIVKGGG
jgi:hypothetical protein